MRIQYLKKYTAPNGKVFKKGTEADVFLLFGRELIKKRIAKQIEEEDYGNDRSREWK